MWILCIKEQKQHCLIMFWSFQRRSHIMHAHKVHSWADVLNQASSADFYHQFKWNFKNSENLSFSSISQHLNVQLRTEDCSETCSQVLRRSSSLKRFSCVKKQNLFTMNDWMTEHQDVSVNLIWDSQKINQSPEHWLYVLWSINNVLNQNRSIPKYDLYFHPYYLVTKYTYHTVLFIRSSWILLYTNTKLHLQVHLCLFLVLH